MCVVILEILFCDDDLEFSTYTACQKNKGDWKNCQQWQQRKLYFYYPSVV